jgi:hypothetical protein
VRVGTAAEMADAVTRSYLGDGRVVGWYGAPGAVVDAEIRGAEPSHLVARFGREDFLGRWTRAECAAKLADVPMHLWLERHGLTAPGVEVETIVVDDLVISVAPSVSWATSLEYRHGRDLAHAP